MKKTLSILLFVAAGLPIFSQTVEDYSNPSRYSFIPFNPFNITVERPSDAWDYWGCPYCFQTHIQWYHYNPVSDIPGDFDTFYYALDQLVVARYNASNLEPMTVYGVAIPIWDAVQRWDDTAAWLLTRDSLFTGFIAIGGYPREEFYDTIAHCFDVQILDTVHFRMGVNIWPDNLFKFVPPDYDFTCPDSMFRVLEVYFDHPYVMTDTFWVGQRLYFYVEVEENSAPNECCPNYGGLGVPEHLPNALWEDVHYSTIWFNEWYGSWYRVPLPYYLPWGYSWGHLFSIIAPPPCFVIPPLKIRNVHNNCADVMWDNPVSSAYRRIELGPAGFTPGTGIIIDNFYGDSIHFQNLAPDFEYEVHVSSFCSTDSVYTEPTVAFFSTALNCDMPQNVAVADITDSTAIIFWRMTSLSDYSELEYGPAGFSHGEGKLLSPIHSLGTGNCSGMMDSLQPGTAYTAYVRTWCDYTEMYSEWERVDFTTTGVNPNDTADHDTIGIATVEQQRVSIVPNPATNSVTVTAECEILSVEAYNVKGQRIATAEGRGTTLKLDTSAWPNGTYTITIRTVQGSVSRKLVIKK